MKRNLAWIEAARTIAMFIVVAWHCVRQVTSTDKGMPDWVDIPAVILTLAVPLFFLAAGFLAQRSSKTARSTWKVFLSGKAKRVLLPFLLWNVIYLVFSHLVLGWPLWTWKSLWTLCTGFVHLWFIFVLMQLFVVHKLLAGWIQRHGAGLVFLCSAFVCVLWNAFSSYLLITQGNDGHFFEWYWGKFFLGWSVFYFWGAWLAVRPSLLPGLKKNILFVFVATLASAALFFPRLDLQTDMFGTLVRHYFTISGLPFQFVASTFVLLLCMTWEEKRWPGINLLVTQGKDTFGIYLMHFALIFLFAKAWPVLNLSNIVLEIVLMVAFTWCVSWGTVRLCRKMNIGILGG